MRGRHLIKGGFAIPDFSRRGFDDRTNRAGTFTFSTLDDYGTRHAVFVLCSSAATAASCSCRRCSAPSSRTRSTMSDRLSHHAGHCATTGRISSSTTNNLAPRVSAAFAVDKKTVIRGGAGLFYDRAGDGAIHDVLRSRENRLQRYIILDPAYPDAFGGLPAAD